MTISDQSAVNKLKELLSDQISVHKIIIFGSRARGDSQSDSDMDVAVITDYVLTEEERDYVSDCAWEAGFENNIIVVPLVFNKNEWYSSPQSSSLIVKAILRDGITV